MKKQGDSETIQGYIIDLRGYKVGNTDYDVRGSMATLLFHPDQKLTVDEAMDNKNLAEKIRKAGDKILVDRMDYTRLVRAYRAMTSPNEEDLEFFRRIKEAELTEVGGN